MHIPDGLLDAKTCVATAVVAGGAVAYSLSRVRRTFADRAAPLMGVTAASLFAAQMMNFPIPGGTSGHLMGGVLAAVMLGPWSGLLVLTVVLAVQCVLAADGGVTALGANVLNVGVIGCLIGYSLYEPARRWLGGPYGTVFGAVLAAWFSVVLGATACSIELAASGNYRFAPTLGVMLLFHSIIGLGEAAITGLTLGFVLRTRPDLIYGQTSRAGATTRSFQVVLGGVAIALVIAVLLSPFASGLPDGLEAALHRLGPEPETTVVLPAPMPDYVPRGMENLQIAGSVAGAIGTLVAFGIAFGLASSLRSKSSIHHTPHAS